MKIASVLPKEFLEKLQKIDPEMYKFFHETDIDTSNKERTELLQQNANARRNFLEQCASDVEQGKILADVLPRDFICQLKNKDDQIYQLLSISPASQYTYELKKHLNQKKSRELSFLGLIIPVK